MFIVFQNIDPPPPSLPSLGGEGGGGSIFWKTWDIALYSTYESTLCLYRTWHGQYWTPLWPRLGPWMRRRLAASWIDPNPFQSVRPKHLQSILDRPWHHYPFQPVQNKHSNPFCPSDVKIRTLTLTFESDPFCLTSRLNPFQPVFEYIPVRPSWTNAYTSVPTNLKFESIPVHFF